VIYVALLTFLYLLLRGRRIGPPVRRLDPTETQRTMYEHVQMLANLYRRAGQFRVVHDHFVHQYARLMARGARTPRKEEAFARVQSARTESELVAVIATFDDAG
jgi:hypothetical protein